MKITKIVDSKPINFADGTQSAQDIIQYALESIMDYEGTQNIPVELEDYFNIVTAQEDDKFGGAMIGTRMGSYILHDLQQDNPIECTILFYSLSKIEDDAETTTFQGPRGTF